jgi:predicted protein tyrosine phosphatase
MTFAPPGSISDASMTMLIVSPAHYVADLVARRQPSHVISLESPAQETAGTAFENHRRFSFNDITEPRPGLITPSAAMIGDLLDFGRGWDGARPLLIHCWAGISRSCAAAFVLACDRNPGRERAIAAELRSRAPFATPNRLMVRLADDRLRRDGRMVASIDAIGRGAEAPHGAPFDLPVRYSS